MPSQSAASTVRPDPATGGGRLRIGRALLFFLAAYVIVTVLASATTLIYGSINNTWAADSAASSPVRAPSFASTVPYHVLIMLVVWTLFAWLYFRGSARVVRRDQVRETALLSILWLVGAMLVDFVGFVVVRQPWSLTPHQFYVDYQPWITLIYLAIFVSPWLRLVGARTPR